MSFSIPKKDATIHMKQIRKLFFPLLLSMIFLLSTTMTVFAQGDGNIDGGSGDMGEGTSTDIWRNNMDGVRITVVTTDGTVVSTPFDLTNSAWQIMSSTLARSASFSILPVPAFPPVLDPTAAPSPELLSPVLSVVGTTRQASKPSSGISVRNMPPGLYRTKRVSPLRTSSQVPTSWSLNRLRTLFMEDKIML